jgi:hypothetical protein
MIGLVSNVDMLIIIGNRKEIFASGTAALLQKRKRKTDHWKQIGAVPTTHCSIGKMS